MPPLKPCKVLSLEKARSFAIKCKNLFKSSNHFWFTPIMKLVLSTLKKMFRKENFKKVTKIFLRLLNERSRELSHEDPKIKILQQFEIVKCFKGDEIFLNNALNWNKILQFLTTNSKNTQAVNKVEYEKCQKGRSYTLNGVER